MKKATFKEKFSYWFDQKMSNGSLSLIKLLAVVSVVIVIVIAFVIFAFGFNEEGGFLSAFWNSLATIINAWMPYYEDGGPGYLILTAIASLVGLLVTSILIGIIASAIEEKVNDLKCSSSRILEEGHVVILGFYQGEYTLIRQLVLAAGDEPSCIVVAGEADQEDMTQGIRDNVEAPKNVRVICRTVDLFDPVSLEKCAISECRSVVISPTDDFRTTKILLAVSAIIEEAEAENIRVSAIVSREEYRFPPSMAEKHHVTMMESSEVLAKLIAHSCTQPGLSDTFREMFQFEGAELYAESIRGAEGLRFKDAVLRMDRGVPIGIIREQQTMLGPAPDTVLQADDKLILFAEDEGLARLMKVRKYEDTESGPFFDDDVRETVAIIGGNESLPVILRELPGNVSKVIIAAGAMQYKDETMKIADERGDFAVSFFSADIKREEALMDLAKRSAHIVILSDHGKTDDEADMESVFLLLNLRDIRERCGLRFNITAEMRREYNQKLVITGDNTDFVVASNISSLILAQLSECPELFSVFSELLSNEGSEIYLKKIRRQGTAQKTVAEIRKTALEQGSIMIGYRKAGEAQSVLNPAINDVPALNAGDSLIIIGEE